MRMRLMHAFIEIYRKLIYECDENIFFEILYGLIILDLNSNLQIST